ncbi:MAG: methionine--tRNA ligase [Candidatus Wildermuthbacteria bacterium]|nr:methionine--tRNA ligase [Candidatus Wildermuthbacteria bacterium]
MKKKFYVTAAIPYVNAKPHLGHALGFVYADVVARYHKFLGEEVILLSGADENSLKNVQSAEKENITAQALCDKNSRLFQDLAKILNVSFNIFQRSTEKKHFESSQKLWELCEKSGDIYRKFYAGLYCVGCEAVYTEDELENGFCPEHKVRLEKVSEENYFFRLSKYQNQIKELLIRDKLKITPSTRKNEALSFINRGLEDFSISRSRQRARGWGIPVPGDPEQVMYVWFDALNIYQSGIGFGWNEDSYNKWWPANLHIIGKGILRFHAVYWPAMLLSARLPLPKTIFVHGYVTAGGQKISKSLGNAVDPFELVKKYGADAVRYFLLREISPTEDGDFTYEKFERRYNSDLAAGIGNLVARVITLAARLNSKSEVRNPKQILNSKFQTIINKTRKNYKKFLEEFKFNEALAAIWELISFCDEHIEKERPWEESKSQKKVIGYLLSVIGSISQMLEPFLPETSEKIIKQLKTLESQPLFPRVDKSF